MTLSYRDIAAVVDEHFPEFSGPIDEHTTFDDLSFDSLVLVELGSILFARYAIDVAEEDMVAAHTFQGVADLVNRLRVDDVATA